VEVFFVVTKVVRDELSIKKMASFLVNVSSKRLQRSLIFMQTSQFVTARFGDRTLDSQVTNAAGASTKKISSEVQDRIKGAYFGALIGDALCLGSHYEYDAPTIKQAYGGQPLQVYRFCIEFNSIFGITVTFVRFVICGQIKLHHN